MSTTSNLSLITGQSDSTRFSSYTSVIDQNFQKIDDFAGAIKGAGGTATIYAAQWSSNTYTLSINDLGDNDAIFICPSTAADKLLMEDAEIFVNPVTNGHNVTITAETTPSSDISINYFITRG